MAVLTEWQARTVGAYRKRSFSFPAELSDAVSEAAAAAGVTVSAWLADAARQMLAATNRDGHIEAI